MSATHQRLRNAVSLNGWIPVRSSAPKATSSKLERRGYLQAGPFVPGVVIEHPDAVTRLHEDFVHAGSDVVEAFTYYAHRQKLKVIGREDILEQINRQALRIAKDVADRNGCLMAGNICNTNAYEASDLKTHSTVRAMFEEQIGWAVEEGAISSSPKPSTGMAKRRSRST